MSRLTRDGTAEPVSREQILRHVREQGNIIFPIQLTTSRIGDLTRLIHTMLYVMTIHTYIYVLVQYCYLYLFIQLHFYFGDIYIRARFIALYAYMSNYSGRLYVELCLYV